MFKTFLQFSLFIGSFSLLVYYSTFQIWDTREIKSILQDVRTECIATNNEMVSFKRDVVRLDRRLDKYIREVDKISSTTKDLSDEIFGYYNYINL